MTVILLLVAAWYQPKPANAQQTEVGVRVVLSGAVLFGPYVSYWVDDHNELNASVLAAYVGQFIVPFAVNAGYSAHFFHTRVRPEIGIQYSYLISPRRHKAPTDPNGISILALMPGAQFRWDEAAQNVQSRVWLAYILDKPKKAKFSLMPIGLDFSYGYRW